MSDRREHRAVRICQLLLMVAAGGLWAASRLPWVTIRTFDGLTQPKTITLTGSTWSSALLPLAMLLAAAALAALAVHGWPMRLLAALVAAASAAAGYLAISQWVIPDIAVRAADLAGVEVMFLVGSDRHYVGAGVTLSAAIAALVAAVLLIHSASAARVTTSKYVAPRARRSAARTGELGSTGPNAASERLIWDALDEGRDPTVQEPPADPGAGEGR